MKTRMPFEERRGHILAAVRETFARKGVAGATTRDLAKAAGVSEALLFQHFKSKESLYHAMLLESGQDILMDLQKILLLEPSTLTLILLIHFLYSTFLTSKKQEIQIFGRLYTRSLTEGGEFARYMNMQKEGPRSAIAKMVESLKAAQISNDLIDSPIPKTLRGWFADRLGIALMSDLLPNPPAIDFGVSNEKLVEHAVWFSLRGLGLKEEAIRRHYTAKMLARWSL